MNKIKLIAIILITVLLLSLCISINVYRRNFSLELSGTHFYVNGKLMESTQPEPDMTQNDVRKLAYDREQTLYVSYPEGFSLTLPPSSIPDFSIAEKVVSFKSKLADIVVSKEPVPLLYEPKAYVAEYVNRYLLAPSYLEQNHITLHRNDFQKYGNYEVQIVAVERTPAKGSEIKRNAYVYCYIYADTHLMYRILFKANAISDKLTSQVEKTLSSFSDALTPIGTIHPCAEFEPKLPENWSEETKALYDEIRSSDTVWWGVFISQAMKDPELPLVKEMEKKIDYDLEVLLNYVYYDEPFPLEGMRAAHNSGKVVELTVQVSTPMNQNLDGYNPMFDLADGVMDDKIRAFAKGAKEFGKPFLFRLNNEMNSDWVSYGATATMNDPQFFISVWKRFYRIFEEEGVNNVIWIFNPNNNSYPPQPYNNTLCYYPGNEYVQLFGVTGYNTGTYYAMENMEGWHEFEELYDQIEETSMPYFSKFPWIITEFGSSSVGGDKSRWILDMFKTIPKYKNIKIAVWFNANDYDPRPEKNNAVARPYVLDETPATTNAFRQGIAAFK